MHTFSFRYTFSQLFAVSATEAYKWCTDFRPNDYSLMGSRGRRKITKIIPDTLILTDTLYAEGKRVVKEKLVRLDPLQHSWTATYLSGPNKYSQFLYRITPRGPNSSALEFIGLQLEESKTKVSPEEVAAMAHRVREEDAETWKRLAQAMEEELSKS